MMWIQVLVAAGKKLKGVGKSSIIRAMSEAKGVEVIELEINGDPLIGEDRAPEDNTSRRRNAAGKQGYESRKTYVDVDTGLLMCKDCTAAVCEECYICDCNACECDGCDCECECGDGKG